MSKSAMGVKGNAATKPGKNGGKHPGDGTKAYKGKGRSTRGAMSGRGSSKLGSEMPYKGGKGRAGTQKLKKTGKLKATTPGASSGKSPSGGMGKVKGGQMTRSDNGKNKRSARTGGY